MTHDPIPATAPSRPTLTATCGLPAAGKSTWARAQLAQNPTGHLVRCNRDDLRRMLHGTPRYDQASEALVTAIQRVVLGELLDRGHSVIVDDTHLNPEHLQALAVLAKNHGVAFTQQDFTDVPPEVCIARDAPPVR